MERKIANYIPLSVFGSKRLFPDKKAAVDAPSTCDHTHVCGGAKYYMYGACINVWGMHVAIDKGERKGLTACDPMPPNTRVGEPLTVKLLAESTSAAKAAFT